jgi:hypothetical protein
VEQVVVVVSKLEVEVEQVFVTVVVIEVEVVVSQVVAQVVVVETPRILKLTPM